MNELLKNRHIQIRDLLYNSIKDSTWKYHLKWFFYDDQIFDIIKTLDDKHNLGYKWSPEPDKMFDTFEDDNFNDLKVVFINKEPSSNYKSKGKAFYFINKNKPYYHIQFEKAIGKKVNYDDWSKQGVLLLNLSLTSDIKTKGKHIDIWKPFREYLFELLSSKDVIYVIFGKNIWDYEKEIKGSGDILKVTSPSQLRFSNRDWKDSYIFKEVNNKLKLNGKNEIEW